MSVNSRLLQLLVCPVCKGPLKANRAAADSAAPHTLEATMPVGEPVSEPASAPPHAMPTSSPIEGQPPSSQAPTWTLVCAADHLAFMVRDGIAVMIESEAQVLAPS